MMKKILSWIAIGALVLALSIVVYWIAESNVWIPGSKVVIVSQNEGDAIAIEIPTENYEKALGRFDMKTRVRTRGGDLIKETDWVAYQPRMKYKFVTSSQLPAGDYVARLVVGYQLNPLSYREAEYPMAIIYVYRNNDDHFGPAQTLFWRSRIAEPSGWDQRNTGALRHQHATSDPILSDSLSR